MKSGKTGWVEGENGEIYCSGTYQGHNCHTLVGYKMNGQITFYSSTTTTDTTGYVKCKTCGSYVSRPKTSY